MDIKGPFAHVQFARDTGPVFTVCWLVFLFSSLLSGCTLFDTEHPSDCFVRSSAAPDSVAGTPLIYWHPEATTFPATDCGKSGERVSTHLNLSRLHGETEFTRNARFVDLDGDGKKEILTRTMNENQVRALDRESGRTLWVSPAVLPASRHPQASDLAVRDIDGDGTPEILILSYDGHVLCIEGSDGSIQWRRKLSYHINNPDLPVSLANITEDPGLELALTVSNNFEWGSRTRPRINQMYNPSLLVLKSDGSQSWIAQNYDVSNSNGHRTWTHDVDGDQWSEVFAPGDGKIVAFDHEGTRMFTLPLQEGSHADQVVFGDWTDEHPGDEILYTNGIHEIVVASNTGRILQRHEPVDALAGHLQDIVFISSPNGPRLLAQNIRSRNSKTVLYDETFRPLWAAQLGYHAAMQTTIVRDWNQDGVSEIATGSLSERFDQQCSLQIMNLDGRPLYWHRWNGSPLCVVSDSDDTTLLVGVGRPEGDAGRYSLGSGSTMDLYAITAVD